MFGGFGCTVESLDKVGSADSPVIEPLGICGLVKLQIVRIERCEELIAGASQV